MKSTARLIALVALLSTTTVIAEDWPGIYGPRRDHTSDKKGLLRSWAPGGPKTLWSVPMGAGFGGPAVGGGRVYVLDREERVGDTLRVLDLASGKQLWTFTYDAPGRFMFAGSRTTPTLDGDLVYTVGPMGDLHALSGKTQKPIWHKNIWKDFGGSDELPRWATVQNPLTPDRLRHEQATRHGGCYPAGSTRLPVQWSSTCMAKSLSFVMMAAPTWLA